MQKTICILITITIKATCCFSFSSVPNNILVLQRSARNTLCGFPFARASKLPLRRLSGHLPTFLRMDSDCPDCAEDPEQENQISNDSPSPEVTNSGIVVPPGFVVIPYPNVNCTAVFDSLLHDVICMIALDLAIFYQNGFING